MCVVCLGCTAGAAEPDAAADGSRPGEATTLLHVLMTHHAKLFHDTVTRGAGCNYEWLLLCRIG
jgi:hypothetical protein